MIHLIMSAQWIRHAECMNDSTKPQSNNTKYNVDDGITSTTSIQTNC